MDHTITDYTKLLIKEIEERNKIQGAFVEKNETEFKLNKFYNSSKNILDSKNSYYIYDLECNTLGIIYRNFFTDDFKDLDLSSIVLNNPSIIEHGIIDNEDMTESQFKLLNKYFKPIIKKIESYFKKNFYLNKPQKKLFTTDFNNIIIHRNNRMKLKKDENQYNSYSSIFYLSKSKNEYININIPEYDLSIPLLTNKDLSLLDTKKILYCNDNIKLESSKNLTKIQIS